MFEAFNEDKFDFETWAELAEKDPAAFEAKRKAMLEEVIEQSPEYLKQRLQGLQFQVDSQRRLAKNPIDSMQKLYSMMMSKVYEENGLLHAMEALTQPRKTKPLVNKAEQARRHSATVIAFDEVEEA